MYGCRAAWTVSQRSRQSAHIMLGPGHWQEPGVPGSWASQLQKMWSAMSRLPTPASHLFRIAPRTLPMDSGV